MVTIVANYNKHKVTYHNAVVARSRVEEFPDNFYYLIVSQDMASILFNSNVQRKES